MPRFLFALAVKSLAEAVRHNPAIWMNTLYPVYCTTTDALFVYLFGWTWKCHRALVPCRTVCPVGVSQTLKVSLSTQGHI